MTDNTPLNADPNLRRTVNQMLDFFTEPDKGEKYLKDLEDEIVELVKKHELQAKLKTVKRISDYYNSTQGDDFQAYITGYVSGLKQELQSYE